MAEIKNNNQEQLKDKEELPVIENVDILKTAVLSDEEMKELTLKQEVKQKQNAKEEIENEDIFEDALDESQEEDLFEDALDELPKEEKEENGEERVLELNEIVKEEVKKDVIEEPKEEEKDDKLHLERMKPEEIQQLYRQLKDGKKKLEEEATKKVNKDLETEWYRKITSEESEKFLDEYARLKIKRREIYEDTIKEGYVGEFLKKKENELENLKNKKNEIKLKFDVFTGEDIVNSENLYLYERRGNNIGLKSQKDMVYYNMKDYYEKLRKVSDYMWDNNIAKPRKASKLGRMIKGVIEKYIISKETRRRIVKNYHALMSSIKERLFPKSNKIEVAKAVKERKNLQKYINRNSKRLDVDIKKALEEQVVELEKLNSMYRLFIRSFGAYDNKKELEKMLQNHVNLGIKHVKENINRIKHNKEIIDFKQLDSKKEKSMTQEDGVILKTNRIEDIEDVSEVEKRRRFIEPQIILQQIPQQIVAQAKEDIKIEPVGQPEIKPLEQVTQPSNKKDEHTLKF